jgi:hypothetical protein
MIFFSAISLISSMIFGMELQNQKYEFEDAILIKNTEFEQSQTHSYDNIPVGENEINNACNSDHLPIIASFKDNEVNDNYLLQASTNIFEASYESSECFDRTLFNYNADDISDVNFDEISRNYLLDFDPLDNFCLKSSNSESVAMTEIVENSFDQSILKYTTNPPEDINMLLEDVNEIVLKEMTNVPSEDTKNPPEDINMLLEDVNEIVIKEMTNVLSEDTKVTLERKSEEINNNNVVDDENVIEIEEFLNNTDANEQNIKKSTDKSNNILLSKDLEISANLRRFRKPLSKKDRMKCLKRIRTIEYIVKLFDKNKSTSEVQRFSKILNDNELEKALRLVHKVFDKYRTFDKKNYSLLADKILKVLEKSKEFYNLRWKSLTKKDRILIFYHEFLRLYRYAPQFPEILTLGGISIEQLVSAQPFWLHLINVFIEKIDNLEENKDFITCLIYIAQAFSSKSKKKLFIVPNCKLICEKNHEDLYYFMWELTSEIQNKIQQKIREEYFNDPLYTHTIYLKTVVMLFLYQHFIFLKFHDLLTAESIELFDAFYIKLKYTDECVGCIYDEIMVLIRNQVVNL